MKKKTLTYQVLTVLLFYLFTFLPLSAQFVTGTDIQYKGMKDSRCLDIMGVPLEGPDSVFVPALESVGFERIISEDDEPGDYYFRGDYYGIKANLVVSVDENTKLLSIVP